MSRGETNFHICLFLFFSLLGFVPAVLAVLTWMAAFSDGHQKCPYKAGYLVAVHATYLSISSLASIGLMIIEENSTADIANKKESLMAMCWIISFGAIPTIAVLTMQQVYCLDVPKLASSMFWIVEIAWLIIMITGMIVKVEGYEQMCI